MLIFGYCPPSGMAEESGVYVSFANPVQRLTQAGFVDSGARTQPIASYEYAGGAVIYGGLVRADGTIDGAAAAAPDAAAIDTISRSVARSRPDSLADTAYLVAWAAEHPGATVYAAIK